MNNHSAPDLTQGSLGTLMRRYSIPCIISLLVGALYNIVDQIYIANADYLGSYGNAANSVVFPLTVIALAIATMIGDGCCAAVSLSLGSGDRRRAAGCIGTSVTAVVISSVVLTSVYLIFGNTILCAFGADVNGETLAMAGEYFFWISVGIPVYMFGQAVNPIIRSDGSPAVAMASLLAGAVCNCILDPIFIYGFRWGMMGAAIATVAGQALSAVIAGAYLARMKSCKLTPNDMKPSLPLLRHIIPLGFTSFMSQIAVVLSMAAVLNMCRKYAALDPVFGKAEYTQIPTAVIGIVMKFYQIVISAAIGLSAGCIPIIGYNLGAGRRERAGGVMIRLAAAEGVIGLVGAAIALIFPHQLIGIFGASDESIYYTEFAVRCIRLFLCTLPLSCINKGVVISLQALGRPWVSTALSVFREVGLGVGLVLILPLWFGLDGLLFFMAAADIIAFIPTLITAVPRVQRLGVKTDTGVS